MSATAFLPGSGVEFTQWKGKVEVDVERGMEILVLGAEKGDPSCQHLIGINYSEGSGSLPKHAKRWLLAATEQGHAIAEYNLAIVFKDEGNDAEYLRYLRGSASKGYDDACYFWAKLITMANPVSNSQQKRQSAC